MADNEVFRTLPWPFEGHGFPPALGAVVQKTVLDGTLPALVIGHDAGGGWYVGDGVNDPNAPGAAVATHISHAVVHNSSLSALAALPPGHVARRQSPRDPWRIEKVTLEP